MQYSGEVFLIPENFRVSELSQALKLIWFVGR